MNPSSPSRSKRAAGASAWGATERLPISILIGYGLPQIPLSFMAALAGMYLLKFASDVLLIAPALFSILFAFSRVCDAISDPIAGYWSDRTRLAAGRRRPWILAGAVPMAVTFWAIWSPPGALDPRVATIWMGAAIVLYFTAYTIAAVPHLALGAELSNDYHERNRVFGSRGIFEFAGLLAAAGAMGWLQTSADPRAVGRQIAVLFGVVTLASLSACVARLRERREYQGRGGQSPLRAFADVAGNPHARTLILATVLEGLSLSLLGALFPFVAEYMIPDGSIGSVYVVGALAVAVVVFPAWFPLARRFGKRGAWLLAHAMKIAGFACVLVIGPDTMWLYPVVLVLIGGSMSCSVVMPPSMQSDVVDHDEFVTGERKEGSYFAAWNFSRKVANAIAIGASGVVLQLAGYEANAVQSESSLAAIAALFAGVPLVLHALAIVVLQRFRLDEAEHGRIREELDRRARSAPEQEASRT